MGERIVKLRERLEWSQAQMADALGVSQATVCRIENGQQEASKSVLKLVDVLENKLREVSI